MSHGAAGKDIFDAEKVPSTDAPLGSVELLGAEDAVAFEARAAKNAERTLKVSGHCTFPQRRTACRPLSYFEPVGVDGITGYFSSKR